MSIAWFNATVARSCSPFTIHAEASFNSLDASPNWKRRTFGFKLQDYPRSFAHFLISFAGLSDISGSLKTIAEPLKIQGFALKILVNRRFDLQQRVPCLPDLLVSRQGFLGIPDPQFKKAQSVFRHRQNLPIIRLFGLFLDERKEFCFRSSEQFARLLILSLSKAQESRLLIAVSQVGPGTVSEEPTT